jgi:hypothetical protein
MSLFERYLTLWVIFCAVSGSSTLARHRHHAVHQLGAETVLDGAIGVVRNRGAVGYAIGVGGGVVCFSGQGDRFRALAYRNAGSADHVTSVLQFWAGLLAQPPFWCGALRGGPIGSDRRFQFFCADGGCCNKPVRL